MAYLGGYWGFWKLFRHISSAAHKIQASFPAEPHTAFDSAYIAQLFCEHCVRPTKAYWWKPITQLSGYASVDTTNVLSSYFVEMHRFALMWLLYSRNKFFRVGPNISEKFVPEGTNFRGVPIKCDRHKWVMKPLTIFLLWGGIVTSFLSRQRWTGQYVDFTWTTLHCRDSTKSKIM